jgi:hypothetical protein
MRFYLLPTVCLVLLAGCNAIPDVRHQPTFHNPFPQLERVAVLPFNNLSDNPYVDGDAVADAYYEELQKIPGFVVVPLERVKMLLRARHTDLATVDDVRELGRQLQVDAIAVGAVTEFDPYYPPRLGLAVDWYATNPGFHPIPPGYGLPWGRAEEEYIPDAIVRDAEFALAKAQLRTQTPVYAEPGTNRIVPVQAAQPLPPPATDESVPAPHADPRAVPGAPGATGTSDATAPPDLPPDWPDPRGFVPPPPSPHPPPCIPHYGPIIEHTRLYDGKDSALTAALSDYFYFADDARFGGWQAYLQRSEDFIRFCCYLSITEMLAARGGTGKTRVVWRWPISRYER